MMTNEDPTKIVNFMNPGAGVLVLGHGHISQIVKMHYLLLHQYTPRWLLFYIGIIMLLSNAIVDYFFLNDVAVDMQIWALLTRSWCRVSDTQVTVKACGPLVLSFNQHYCIIIAIVFNLFWWVMWPMGLKFFSKPHILWHPFWFRFVEPQM